MRQTCKLMRSSVVLIALALVLVPSLLRGESKENSTKLNQVTAFLADKDGKAITNPLIFESRKNNPINAPDGHQLTFAEFNSVQGTISVRCMNKGTRAVINLTGLIPNGVYTIWLLVFGPDPSKGPIAVGALGQSDGSGNAFTADEDGVAVISATNPGGDLSASGSIGNCWLTDQDEVHVVGAYHLDGKTNGTSPGPPGSFVEQFAFPFRQ